MLRLLSWSGCDKLATPEMRMFVPKNEASSGTGLQQSTSLKRKHSPPEVALEMKDDANTAGVNESNSARQVKRSKGLEPSEHDHFGRQEVTKALPTPLQSPRETNMDDSNSLKRSEFPTPRKLSESKKESLRQTIQMQLNTEILLKNNELRLIEQELAKSQVALEQLRRCTEIPYPISRPSLAVSDGTGSSLRSSFPTLLPESPAAWGVTEGPYSRHYAKWLIPDSRFDGGEPDTLTTRSAGKTSMKSRSMRGSFLESEQSTSTSRAQRGGQLQSLPAGYVQPKEKASGPMILKRKSDGVMVKLVCPDCGRSDFGSAQGFINHCRIGHSRSFASHDAAAEACGDPVEYDASGAIVGAEPTPTLLTSNVHPLIRSATLLTPTPLVVGQLHGINSEPSQIARVVSPKVSADFRASSVTPHLSALIKEKGLGLDLEDVVADAKMKSELPESDDEYSDIDLDTPEVNLTGGRHPRVAGSKLPPKPAKSPSSSPLLSSRMKFPSSSREVTSTQPSHPVLRGGFQNRDAITEQQSEMVPFNPSPTTESNQAPSLVDDDEDFGPHSPSSSSESEDNDDVEVDFEVQDDEDNARESVILAPEFRPSCAQPPPHNTRTHGQKTFSYSASRRE